MTEVDRNGVLEAVQKCGLALRYAQPELQGDRELVMKAVQQSSGALEFASKELQGDREVGDGSSEA